MNKNNNNHKNQKEEELRKENERLKREIEELRRRFEKLRKEKEAIEKEKETIEKKKEAIEREFEEYKLRHPETVGVKNGKPYHLKPPTTSTSKAPGKPGAKPGHKPAYRALPQRVDEFIKVPVTLCPHCQGTNLSRVQETRSRTIEDLPICEPLVKQFEIERRYCRDCKKLVETPVVEALPNARFSLRVMLIVVWLRIQLRQPVEAIPKLLKSLFDLNMSEGEVIEILAQVDRAFGSYYEELIEGVRSASARGMDETSWRINGENVWLWAFITKGIALYKIAYSRGHEVPLEVLGCDAKGVDIHDRFSAYETLARKTRRAQQICWAHLLQDARELASFYGADGKRLQRILKRIYIEAKQFNHQGNQGDVEKLYRDLKFHLGQGFKSTHCRKFAENLLKAKDKLFTFVTNPEVDSTNNAAERGLRHSVIARKISGGSKSERGAQIYERLTSIVHTLNKKNQNLLTHGPKIITTSHG